MKVLFVCTGNICRSPLAAHAFARTCAALGLPIEIESAGTHGLTGCGAAETTLETAAERGLDLSSHRARRVSLEMLDECDLVIVMEREQLRQIRAMCGAEGPRIRLLGEFHPRRLRGDEVPDPYGGSRREYEHARDLILESVEGLAQHLLESRANP